MAIRALLFDLWGTLLLYAREAGDMDARQQRTVEGLANAGYPYPADAIAAALRAFSDEHAAMHGQGRDVSQPERTEMLLDRIEPGLARRVSTAYLRAIEDTLDELRLADRRERTLPAPGAAEVLDEARRMSLALGLVSITGLTRGYVLRQVLAAHGLLQHFDAMTFSDEARMAKPAPEIYHCTLETLGVQPREAVFVGDTPLADVAGPREVGMWTVQVGDREEDGIEPHARIDALPELFPALRSLGLLSPPPPAESHSPR